MKKTEQESIKKDEHACVMMPGLGLSSDIFKCLELSFDTYILLEWIPPIFNEDMDAYCQRLLAPVDLNLYASTTIIGHSFGGIIAQQMACIFPIDQLILVSTIMNEKEKPRGVHIIKYLPDFFMNRIKGFIQLSYPLWANQHGYSSPSLRNLFKEAIKTLPAYYYHWSLRQIQKWKCPEITCPVLRLHGQLDKTFPITTLKTDYIRVEDGDHLMIYKKAEEVSKHINNLIKNGRLDT